jgi:hypothetical protein
MHNRRGLFLFCFLAGVLFLAAAAQAAAPAPLKVLAIHPTGPPRGSSRSQSPSTNPWWRWALWTVPRKRSRSSLTALSGRFRGQRVHPGL